MGGEDLFHTTATAWTHHSAKASPWRKLAVYALDETTVRVPDSPDNWEPFGGNPGNGIRAGSAYPTVRAVALMTARSHLVAAVRFGGQGAPGRIPEHLLELRRHPGLLLLPEQRSERRYPRVVKQLEVIGQGLAKFCQVFKPTPLKV